MQHKRAKFTLGRTANHRLSLFRGLTSQLLEHGSIVTTQTKAKALRRHFEPLVTEAKQDLTLHRRRNLLRKLAAPGDLDALRAVAKANEKRTGGYLRLTRLPITRHDGAPEVRIELVDKPSS